MKRIAQFTYYGSSPDKHRVVSMDFDGEKYIVSVEGYPALTQRTTDFERAKGVLEGWHEMSWKDWGASEIIWFE